jgi:release factor glutamine methyltransferase
MAETENKTWTIQSIVQWATEDFRSRGIDTPKLDAEVLVMACLGVGRMQLVLERERPLEARELTRLREFIKRRRAREPVAYILGEREFFGHRFVVDKHVLIPRPDTESLVEVALARTKSLSLSARILDICTGSGCVAIALAKERRTSQVLGLDVSPEAVAVATANAIRLGAYNAAFRESDLLTAIPSDARFELIVSNPPYIPSAEIAELAPEITGFEPRLALDGGSDGLDFYRTLVAQCALRLVPEGILAVEVGAGQAAQVATLMREAGFDQIELTRDLGQIERVVSGKRRHRT